MASAYVLINCNFGFECDIINKLNELPNVVDVNRVYGVYDIIVKIEADTPEKVREVVNSDIREIDNVQSTLTLVQSHE